MSISSIEFFNFELFGIKSKLFVVDLGISLKVGDPISLRIFFVVTGRIISCGCWSTLGWAESYSEDLRDTLLDSLLEDLPDFIF